MKLYTLFAKNQKEMDNLAITLSDNKFSMHSSADNFILMKKRRYGNFYVHILSLLIALFVFNPVIIINVVYFGYSFLFNSPHVLITTESHDDEGNPLEFNSMDEILKKANALF